MIHCTNQIQTGKSCAGTVLSREITCEYSVTKCLKDCTSACPYLNKLSPNNIPQTVQPRQNQLNPAIRTRPHGQPSASASGGCGCGGGGHSANNLNAYTSIGTGATY